MSFQKSFVGDSLTIKWHPNRVCYRFWQEGLSQLRHPLKMVNHTELHKITLLSLNPPHSLRHLHNMWLFFTLVKMHCSFAFSQLQELCLFTTRDSRHSIHLRRSSRIIYARDMKTVTEVKIPAAPLLHWRRLFSPGSGNPRHSVWLHCTGPSVLCT